MNSFMILGSSDAIKAWNKGDWELAEHVACMVNTENVLLEKLTGDEIRKN